MLSKTTTKRLDEKLKKLNAERPLSETAVRKLREHFEIEMTYNSNAIEGNSLTLRETFLVIHEGITIKGKPLKDHLEATNHKEALSYLYELIEHGKQHTFSEHLIKSLHQLVTQNIEKEWAGRYRNGPVMIGGTPHRPPDALQVPILMQQLLEWGKKQQRKLHPVEFAAIFHHKFVHIHPFFDGNGRTGRLLMNLILLQHGYPLTIILKHDRSRYYRVLAQADTENYEPLIQFIAQAVDRSLTLYLDALVPVAKAQRKKYITLTEASTMSRYSAKYLNWLAAKGKLSAHKQGRNWVTTKEAIAEYIASRERKR